MSNTPIFDQTVAASDPELRRSSHIFPQQSTHWSVAAQYLVRPNPVDSPTRKPWSPVQTKVIPNPKPEPKWRTFLRCLLWWLP